MKKNILKIKNILSSLFFNYTINIPVFWFTGKNNFGDEINLYLIEKLSKKKVIKVLPKYFFNTHYLCIGSILEKTQKHSIIWGSGFISQNSKVKKPKKIYSVRGPKTREKFLEHNIECPEVYGDPALLLPLFYTPKFNKQYDIGIVPHYVDKEIAKNMTIFKGNNIKIIDIQQENILNFIEELSQCSLILSSSLHGLIVSDAYGIDNMWIKFSTNVVGDDFKFYDYFESVGRLNEKSYFINNSSSIDEILKSHTKSPTDIDFNKILKSCPFYRSENHEK